MWLIHSKQAELVLFVCSTQLIQTLSSVNTHIIHSWIAYSKPKINGLQTSALKDIFNVKAVCVCPSSSKFISVVDGRGRGHIVSIQGSRGDGSLAVLLASPLGVLAVPVGGHPLVVPDVGGLRVAEVARFPGVVCREEQQRLHWEHLQVPPLKLSQVLLTEETHRLQRKHGCNKGKKEFLGFIHIDCPWAETYLGCLLNMMGRNSSTGSILPRGWVSRSLLAPFSDRV